MWLKYITIVILFYVLGLVQNSFFAGLKLHVDLIFLLFYLFVFFEKRNNYLAFIFFAFCAGIFKDIFSVEYIGLSSIIFLVIGFTVKQLQYVFNMRKDDDSLPNFLIFFIISFIIYEALSKAVFRFNFNILHAITYTFLKDLLVNAIAAVILFFIVHYASMYLSGRKLKQLKLNF